MTDLSNDFQQFSVSTSGGDIGDTQQFPGGYRRASPAYRSRAADWGMPSLNTVGGGPNSGLMRGGSNDRIASPLGAAIDASFRAPPRKPTRKYNKLELLQLYQPTDTLHGGFIEQSISEIVISLGCKEPLNKTFFKMDKDAKINPDFVYARGRGISTGSAVPSARGRGRGASVGRGRGGRGALVAPALEGGMPSWEIGRASCRERVL